MKELLTQRELLQRVPQIGYLAPTGTFTEMAARAVEQSAGRPLELIGISKISEIYRLVSDGTLPWGIAPLENFDDGHVIDSVISIVQTPNLYIYGEVIIPIEHHLYCHDPSKVKIIASKGTAIEQCRVFLDKTFPGWEKKAVDSTTAGILLAAEKEEYAGIGSAIAGASLKLPDDFRKYGGIQDNPNNATRFILFSHVKKDLERTGNDKTALQLDLPDVPGSLYRTLEIFYRSGINLSEIKSAPKMDGAVPFLITVDGHMQDTALQAVLGELNYFSEVRTLGSYPRYLYEQKALAKPVEISYIAEKLKLKMLENKTPTGHETIVVYTLQDRSGALHDSLSPFASRNINLTQIDSLPTGIAGQYAFYLGFQNDLAPKDKEAVITELKAQATQLTSFAA